MLWWSGSLAEQSVVTTAIAGVIVGLLWYWLYDRFSKRTER
jgi:hypothetical protein